MGFVVEITQRGGRIVEHHRFDKTTATIGRGYDCDVILDDPYVDAVHVRVFNSLNGLRLDIVSEAHTHVDGKPAPSDSMPMASGTELTLGKTHLRIVSTTHPVPPALAFDPVDRLLTSLARPWVAGFATLGFLVLTGLSIYYNTTEEFAFSKWLTRTITPTFGAVAWVGFSALITRIVRSESRFLQHWMMMLAFLTATLLYRYLNEMLEFNLGDHTLVTVLNYAIPGVLLTALLWMQLRIALRQSNLARTLVSVGLAWGFVAYGFISSYSSDTDFSPRPQFETILLPRALLWRDSTPTEAFLQDGAALFEFPEETPPEAR